MALTLLLLLKTSGSAKSMSKIRSLVGFSFYILIYDINHVKTTHLEIEHKLICKCLMLFSCCSDNSLSCNPSIQCIYVPCDCYINSYMWIHLSIKLTFRDTI